MTYKFGTLLILFCVVTAGVAGVLVMNNMDHGQEHACALAVLPVGDCPPSVSAAALALHHASVLDILSLSLPNASAVISIALAGFLLLYIAWSAGNYLVDAQRAARSWRQRFFNRKIQLNTQKQTYIRWISFHNKQELPSAFWAFGAPAS